MDTSLAVQGCRKLGRGARSAPRVAFAPGAERRRHLSGHGTTARWSGAVPCARQRLRNSEARNRLKAEDRSTTGSLSGSIRKSGRTIAPRDPQQALAAKLRGVYPYFGLPLCFPALAKVRHQVLRYWHETLRRRSQTRRATWAGVNQRPWFTLPAPRVLHPEV